jgi:hypothetical protein
MIAKEDVEFEGCAEGGSTRHLLFADLLVGKAAEGQEQTTIRRRLSSNGNAAEWTDRQLNNHLAEVSLGLSTRMSIPVEGTKFSDLKNTTFIEQIARKIAAAASNNLKEASRNGAFVQALKDTYSNRNPSAPARSFTVSPDITVSEPLIAYPPTASPTAMPSTDSTPAPTSEPKASKGGIPETRTTVVIIICVVVIGGILAISVGVGTYLASVQTSTNKFIVNPESTDSAKIDLEMDKGGVVMLQPEAGTF